MRLHVLSDLHLERAGFEVPAVDADVLVLAGDIANGIDGIEWAQSVAGGRPVLYLAGNHEFYGHDFPGLITELHEAARGTGVHVLEDGEVVLDGVRFLGCTLWSDFAFAGEDQVTHSMELCERIVNDYKMIRVGHQTLSAAHTRAVHEVSRGWLADRLEAAHDGPTVVITHHAPLIRGEPPSAVLRAIAGAFASDLTPLMSGDRVPLWIYGHTHRAADTEHAGTRILSNPRGYPGEPVEGFDPARVIEI